MSWEFLVSGLAIITLSIVIGLALWSKRRTENIEHERTAEKSSLAKDGPGPQPIHDGS